MAYNPETNIVKMTITAAQIKTLRGAPVQIIPGKAGCVVDLKFVFMKYTFGSVPFGTIVSGDEILLVHGTPPNSLVNTGAAMGFIDQTQNMGQYSAVIWYDPTGDIGVPPANLIGQPVYVYQYNQTSGWNNGTNWTTGDGSVTFTVRYSYIEVAA